MSLHTLHLDDAPLQYAVLGPGTGPAVVMVHGARVDHTVWGQVPPAPGRGGLPGHLPHPSPGLPHPAHARRRRSLPRGVARLLAQFLDRLDLQDVTLVGNDTGGLICQFLLDEAGGAPPRVTRLLLTNSDAFDQCPPSPFNLQFKLFRNPRMGAVVAATMRLGMIRGSQLAYGLLSNSLTPEVTRRWVRPYQEHPEVRQDAAALVRGIDSAEVARVSNGLGRAAIPILACWGMADRWFTPALGRRIAAAANNAPFIEIADARTLVALDQPAELARHILTFAEQPAS